MVLSGNSRELSLADLILVKAQDHGSYRLTLNGPAGDGLILLESGRVVHAAYGGLRPEDAAYSLVTEEDVDYRVEAGAEITGHTLELSSQQLLMEAMRRLDEGVLKHPRQVGIDVSGSNLSESRPRRPPRARKYDESANPEAEALRRAMGRVLFADTPAVGRAKIPSWTVAVAGVLFAAAAAAWLAWAPSEFTTEASFGAAVEASDLVGPRDRLPVLLSGAPPANPSPASALTPTIVCRVLVGVTGRVEDVRLYDPSRENLEAFEQTALEALRNYRFVPAIREGKRVASWVLWPIDFLPAPASSEPVPVEAVFFRGSRSDKLPALLTGMHPSTPYPERPARPHIGCRVLVGTDGRVLVAEVREPRPGFSEYELAAVDTVRGYEFTPGIREGEVVPTWVNWTVKFQ